MDSLLTGSRNLQMTTGTENVGEQSKVVETVVVSNVDGGLGDPSHAKAVGKDKSRTERSARKTRRAKALEEQVPREQGVKGNGQGKDAQIGDVTEQVPVKQTGFAEGDANDRGSENPEKVVVLKDPVKPVEGGSDSTCARTTPGNGVRKGHNSRKKRKSRSSDEDVPGMPEMWQMMKDMMSQMTEIGRSVALVAQQQEPVKEAPALSVQEEARPVSPPEERGVSRHKGREYRECLQQLEGLKMPKFWGGSDPIAASQWRDRLIRNFDGTRCPDEFRRDIALHFLEGDAYNWWLTTKKRYGERIDTFDAFVKEFDRKYFPPEARDRMEAEFLHLVQGKMSVREYEERFNALRRYVSEHDPEDLQVRRFLRGLRADIMIPCSVRTFVSVAELVEKAVLIEEGLAVKDRVIRRDERRGSDSASRKRKYDDMGRSSDRLSCAKCGRAHSGQCLQGSRVSTRVSGASFVDHRSCYYCKKPGHIAKDCPEKDSGNRGRYTDRGGQEAQVRKPAGTPRVYELAKDPGTSGQYEAITGKKPAET